MSKNSDAGKIINILEELDFAENEKRVFLASIRETKYAQTNDDLDAKSQIFEMIREEFK